MLGKFKSWFQRRWRYVCVVLGGIVTIALALIGVYAFMYFLQREENEAKRRLRFEAMNGAKDLVERYHDFLQDLETITETGALGRAFERPDKLAADKALKNFFNRYQALLKSVSLIVGPNQRLELKRESVPAKRDTRDPNKQPMSRLEISRVPAPTAVERKAGFDNGFFYLIKPLTVNGETRRVEIVLDYKAFFRGELREIRIDDGLIIGVRKDNGAYLDVLGKRADKPIEFTLDTTTLRAIEERLPAVSMGQLQFDHRPALSRYYMAYEPCVLFGKPMGVLMCRSQAAVFQWVIVTTLTLCGVFLLTKSFTVVSFSLLYRRERRSRRKLQALKPLVQKLLSERNEAIAYTNAEGDILNLNRKFSELMKIQSPDDARGGKLSDASDAPELKLLTDMADNAIKDNQTKEITLNLNKSERDKVMAQAKPFFNEKGRALGALIIIPLSSESTSTTKT